METAFEPIYQNLINYERQMVASDQVAVSTKINLEQPNAKILCYDTQSVITSSEMVGNEIRYNGEATFKIIYVAGENCPKCQIATCDYSGKMSTEMTANLQPMFVVDVMDTSFSQNGNDITISSAIKITATANVENEVKFLSSTNGSVFTKNQDINYMTVSGRKKQNIIITLEQDVKDVLTGVLGASSNLAIKNTSAGLDCAVIHGEVFANVCYYVEEENVCEVKSCDLMANFKEEIEIAGLTVSDGVITNASIVSSKVSAEVDEELSRSKIIMELSVSVDVCGYAEQTVCSVCDVFSPKYNLGVEYNTFNANSLSDKISTVEKISAVVELGDDIECTSIVGYQNFKAIATSCYFKDGNIIIDGVAECCMLLANDKTLQSQLVEIPFSIAENSNAVKNNDEFNLNINVLSILGKIKKMSKVDVKMELGISIDVFSKQSQTVISNIEVLSEKPCEMCGIEIYVSPKELSVWDVAKEMNVKPEIIEKQNKEIGQVIKKGEKVIIYRDNKMMF